MTTFWIGLSIGFVLASFLWWPVLVLSYRRVIRRKMEYIQRKELEIEYLKQAHRSEFADLIKEMNHEGQIPHGATADGLIWVISSGISTCINGLQVLLERKDWDTSGIITAMREIVKELGLLHRKLQEFLESRRDILRRRNKNQGL